MQIIAVLVVFFCSFGLALLKCYFLLFLFQGFYYHRVSSDEEPVTYFSSANKGQPIQSIYEGGNILQNNDGKDNQITMWRKKRAPGDNQRY